LINRIGVDYEMTNAQCFKIKRGTDFHKAIESHFKLRNKWKNVTDKLSELLGETITKIGQDSSYLRIDIEELKNPFNEKLFKKDGTLKANTKQAKDLFKEYQSIISEEGLNGYRSLSVINFCYGVMRRRGQSLESFRTSANDIYYSADFDLAQETNGLVTPITEVEYHEKYIEELKNEEQTT
jgi:hypothetical protein